MVAVTNTANVAHVPVQPGGGGYLPINPEDSALLRRYFPDIVTEPDPIPSRINPAVNRCRAALEVWLKSWYRPRITYWQKYYRPKGYQRHERWD